jgi:hypothetical protein
MSHHITSRTQLITWAADHAPNRVVQQAIDRGEVTVWGLFKGGWVIEAVHNDKSYVIGIRPVGIEGRLVCGLLSRVPMDDYVGGDSPLTRGDKLQHTRQPPNKTRNDHQDHTTN